MSVSAKNDQGFESCHAELKHLFNKKKKRSTVVLLVK